MRDLTVVEVSNVAGGGIQGALLLAKSAASGIGKAVSYAFGGGILGNIVGTIMGGAIGAIGGAVIGFISSDAQATQWAQNIDAMTWPSTAS